MPSTIGIGSGVPFASNNADADVAAYVAAVIANGGTVSGTTISAVSNLVASLKSSGVWAKLYELAPMCGNDLAAAVVKLKWATTQVATNTGFVAGDYTETGSTGGLRNGGVAKFLTAGFNPATVGVGQNDWAFGCYYQQIATTGNSPMGQMSASDPNIIADNNTPTISYHLNNSTGATPGTPLNGSASGLYTNSRLVSGNFTVYRNDGTQSRVITAASASVLSADFYVGRDGYGTTGNGYIRAYFFSRGLTLSEVASLYSAVQAFQTALSRNV